MRRPLAVEAAEAARRALLVARAAQAARSGAARSGAADEEDVAAFVRAATVGALVGAAIAGSWLARARTDPDARTLAPKDTPPDIT